MNLKGFHVLFMTAATVLALGLGAWCLPEHRVAAAASFGVAALFVAYEVWFLRKARQLP